MKNTIQIIIALFIIFFVSSNAIACTMIPDSFCQTNKENPDRNVLSGRIIHIDEDGIDLQLISVLRGTEDRDTIRIWDGTDFDCNGIWSLAASRLGSLNDTIVISLPIIDLLQNSWEVIGDYRMPDSYYIETVRLKIENGILSGFISGFVGSPYYISNIPYDAFLEQWDEQMGDCSMLVATNDIGKQKVSLTYNNPIRSICYIEFQETSSSEKILEIYSYEGRRLKILTSRLDKVALDLSVFPSGLYFVRIFDKNGTEAIIKLVKI